MNTANRLKVVVRDIASWAGGMALLEQRLTAQLRAMEEDAGGERSVGAEAKRASKLLYYGRESVEDGEAFQYPLATVQELSGIMGRIMRKEGVPMWVFPED